SYRFVTVRALYFCLLCFFFSSRRRHTRCYRDWSSDVCSSDLNSSRPCEPGSDAPAAIFLPQRHQKLRSAVASQTYQVVFVRRSVDRKSTRLNSSHGSISYAVFCLKKKKNRHSRDAALLAVSNR